MSSGAELTLPTQTMIKFLLLLFGIPLALAQDIVGPYVGSVRSSEAHFLYSPGKEEKNLQLVVADKQGREVASAKGTCREENDYVAKFRVVGLREGTAYRYRIEEVVGGKQKILENGSDLVFETVDADRSKKVTAVFLSCVKKKDTAPVWEEILKLKPQILCLSGDTPYIDTSNLKTVRAKHRAFLQEEPLAKIGRRTSVVGAWDDHDFGRNNGNGLNMGSGAKATRHGFVEYRAHAEFGQGDGGVYHKSDCGALEIFHLDPRTFSQLGPSPVDASQTTCFGKTQWEWLLKSLKESEAPFKVLSMGAIWQDKKNGETDDMFTYYYERDALLDFIRDEGIEGVILHGGDIHVSRYLLHPMRVGYDLHDFIVSPGHLSVIPSLNPYHPSLEWSLVEGQQFLTLEVDPTKKDPELIATFRQPGGKVNHRVTIRHSDLCPKKQLSTLRGYWRFEGGFENESQLGSRLDGKGRRGASIDRVANGSKGALRLKRDEEQYVSIPRSFLDDNSSGHSVSCWIKPRSLPVHRRGERFFILESTAEGNADDRPAWHLSLELAEGDKASDLSVRMHTRTLVPAAAPEKAPTTQSSGPFITEHSRKDFAERWNHLVMVFDSDSLTLYLNGKKVADHPLPVAGPAAEFGGMIIGGHRAGRGRNFDGWIDELSVWQEVLSAQKIDGLYRRQRKIFQTGSQK